MTNPLPTLLGLAELFPAVSKWIHQPQAQNVAGQIVDLARRVSGKDDAPSILQTIQNNPKLMVHFKKAMTRLDKEAEQTIARDRRDARARDVAMMQVGRRNLRADIMVVSAAVGLMGCLISLAFFRGRLPGEAVGIISTIAGIFGACLKDAFAFEFGSSRGSKEKDERISNVFLNTPPK